MPPNWRMCHLGQIVPPSHRRFDFDFCPAVFQTLYCLLRLFPDRSGSKLRGWSNPYGCDLWWNTNQTECLPHLLLYSKYEVHQSNHLCSCFQKVPITKARQLLALYRECLARYLKVRLHPHTFQMNFPFSTPLYDANLYQ